MAVRKKILLASADQALRNSLVETLHAMFEDVLIVHAGDGGEASIKILNDTPTLILADGFLPKLSGLELVDWMLKEKPDAKIAMIIMAQIPKTEMFVDQVATGQVQFLEDSKDETKLRELLARAVDFASPKQKSDIKIRKILKDEILITEGEKGESVFLVRKGRLEAFSHRGQDTKILGQIENGEFVGEMAYINGEPRSATVKALEESELIEIPIYLLDHVLFTKPAWAKALMKTLSKRVKAANLK